MDLSYPPEAEALREEIRAWSATNRPAGGFDEGFSMTSVERQAFDKEPSAGQ